MTSLLPGGSLGRYQVVEEIGRGGMAVVFRAFDPVLDREVALKALSSYEADDPTFVERFRNEARSVARLSHSNIVQIHDFGEDKGFVYIVMELLTSGTLKDRLVERFSLTESLELLRPLAGALDYAHEQGVIHRDIKPSNVLLTAAGKPVLCDFGIAQILQQSPSLTRTGAAVGTPEYMAPEQALGQSPDRRADLYAMAVIAYQMLLGRTPFRLDNPSEVLMAHIHTAVPPPRTLDPQMGMALEAALLKALAKDPNERYQSAGELIEALAGPTADTRPVSGTAPHPPSQQTTAAAPGPGPSSQAAMVTEALTRETRPRWPMLAAVTLGVVIAVGAGIGVWLANRGDDTDTPPAESAAPAIPAIVPTEPPPAAPVAAAAPATVPPPATPTAGPLDLASTIERTFQRVAAIRGLEPGTDVTWQLVPGDELPQRQGQSLGRAREQFATQQALLEVLGLIPPGLQLFDLTMGLYTRQGLGFYDTHNEELYIALEATDTPVRMERHLAKEYVHALQQQHFDISQKEDEARDSFEASIILRALIEADARTTQAEYALTHLTPEQYRDLLTSGSDNPLFEQAPYALRRLFDFALTDGTALIQALLASGGRDAVDAALAELPASTEQIIHPEKYFASEPVVPVSLPDLAAGLGPGWTDVVGDVMGEFFLKTFLETETEDAAGAAAGWGGDRFSLLESPDGDRVLVLLIAWDTRADAAEFFEVVNTDTTVPDKGFVALQGDRVLVVVGPSEAPLSDIRAQFPGF